MSQRLVLAAAWIAIPLAVLAGGDAPHLLAGWAWRLSLVGAAILAVVAVIACWPGAPAPAEGDPPPWWAWLGRTGIHLLPLAMLALAGVGQVGTDHLGVLAPPTPQRAPAPPERFTPGPHAGGGATPRGGGGTSPVLPRTILPGEIPELTLYDLYEPDQFPGVEQVRAIGMVRRLDDQLRLGAELPPETAVMLVRTLMVCCFADARPIPVALIDRRGDGPPLDSYRDWIRVTGTWIRPSASRPFVAIEVSDAQAIEPPAEPYLSPLAR